MATLCITRFVSFFVVVFEQTANNSVFVFVCFFEVCFLNKKSHHSITSVRLKKYLIMSDFMKFRSSKAMVNFRLIACSSSSQMFFFFESLKRKTRSTVTL